MRDNYPLPLIEDCLEHLEGKSWFTIMDLKSGFYQVKLDEDSTKYTSFVVPNGQYEFLRLPFGLKNGPAIFQRFIAGIFQDFLEKNEMVIYMDDIVIASKTLEEHIILLEKSLSRLATYGLKLKIQKCKFAYTKIEYLGYKVSRKGIEPSDAHVDSIKQYPMPKNVREMQAFLGLCSYFRKFVKGFSLISKPLYKLTKEGAKYIVTDECIEAFEILKKHLASSPILVIYNPRRETELHCDASASGFGSILMQKQDDGLFHPVSYFSKRTTDPETRYHSFELETLAIIYSLRRFRVYLEGICFKIVTDCNSLALTLAKRNINSRIARWALELENYNYSIVHRPGVKMGHVDALSRIDQNNNVVATIEAEDIDFQLCAAQARDKEIADLKVKLERGMVSGYDMVNGVVYKKVNDDIRFFVPKQMENEVIRNTHEKLGHLGVDKCYLKMKDHYWFPEMKQKIDKYRKNCLKCIMYSAPQKPNARTLHSIPKEPRPFHTIHLDHLGPLPSLQSKRKHILVIIDAFTKFVRLYPVLTTSTKEVNAALSKYFDYYSRPVRCITDRGSCFTSKEFSAFLRDKNIDHVKVAVHSPQANGQAERVNRTLTGMLAKLSEPVAHADWVKQLSKIEFAFNNTTNRSIGDTPSRVLFGVNQRGEVVDKLSEYLEEKFLDPGGGIEEIREKAEAAITKTQKYNEQKSMEKGYRVSSFKIGDFVVIKNVDTTIGVNKKLLPKFKGPYVITKVLPNDRYVVKDIENCQITQIPYDGVIEACNIRLWKTDELDESTQSCSDPHCT